MAYSGTQTTRLGGYGGTRPRRPTFTAKSESSTPATTAPFTAIGFMDPFGAIGHMDPTSHSGFMDPFTTTGEM